MKSRAAILVLVALTLCSVVPFAARAVYLDEQIYLHIAETALKKNPLFPQETPWTQFGIPMANLAGHTHPPVGEYYLALMLKILGGFHEISFRLLWVIFPIITVLGFYRLAKRFTGQPLLVSCLFAVSPAFFIMSPTLMMDIPMLGFFLLGLGFYLDCIQDNAPRLWMCAVFFILAAGMGYSILVPMGCLFAWAVVHKRPWRELFTIALSPVVLLIWHIFMRIHFGFIPASGMIVYLPGHFALQSNFLPTFSFLGGVALFPWAFFAIAEISRKRLIAVCSLIAAFSLSFLHHYWVSLPYRCWYILLAASGIALLIAFAMKSARQDPSERHPLHSFLVAWVPTTLIFFLILADMVNARYLLLSVPAIFLVTFDRLRRSGAIAALSVTLVLSVLLAVGDYRYVNHYRDWVEQTIGPLQNQGFRIWNAAESGLRFYLSRKGIQTLDMHDLRPRGGDLIIRQASFRYGLSEHLEPLLLSISKTDVRDRFCLRTFVNSAGAGFHDSHFGIVPFSFSREPLDQIEIVEVSPFVVELPEKVPPDYSTVPVWFPGGVMLKQIEPEMNFPVKLPQNVKVAYTIEGEGSFKISDQGITLKKFNAGPAIWKNFRIIPNGLH
jgi:4-amino-4-deoxy-L-arabinose transferase-like glycosyltransferase